MLDLDFDGAGQRIIAGGSLGLFQIVSIGIQTADGDFTFFIRSQGSGLLFLGDPLDLISGNFAYSGMLEEF